jgi:AcrR family transcriptional regulator
MRRVASEIGASQPVLYSVFSGRQALIDAVALEGFTAIAAAMESADPSPMARMRAYLEFAAAHPSTYEAMFSMPSELPFAQDPPEPLARAVSAIRDVFPEDEDTRAEVAWSTLHGLATLQAGGRIPSSRAQARLEAAHRMLSFDG